MPRDFRSLIGILLILAGVLLGLQQFDILSGTANDALLALAFGAGVVIFALIFFQDRRNWWAALAAFIFAGLTSLFLLDLLLPAQTELGGPLFLFMMSLGFLMVFLLNRIMWWALIPGGVLLSVALTALLDEVAQDVGFDPGGILFVGIGLTFLLLYLLRFEGQRLTWAILPAIPLLLLGLFVGLGNADLWNFIWPGLIILLGLYFVISTLRRKS